MRSILDSSTSHARRCARAFGAVGDERHAGPRLVSTRIWGVHHEVALPALGAHRAQSVLKVLSVLGQRGSRGSAFKQPQKHLAWKPEEGGEGRGGCSRF